MQASANVEADSANCVSKCGFYFGKNPEKLEKYLEYVVHTLAPYVCYRHKMFLSMLARFLRHPYSAKKMIHGMVKGYSSGKAVAPSADGPDDVSVLALTIMDLYQTIAKELPEGVEAPTFRMEEGVPVNYVAFFHIHGGTIDIRRLASAAFSDEFEHMPDSFPCAFLKVRCHEPSNTKCHSEARCECYVRVLIFENLKLIVAGCLNRAQANRVCTEVLRRITPHIKWAKRGSGDQSLQHPRMKRMHFGTTRKKRERTVLPIDCTRKPLDVPTVPKRLRRLPEPQSPLRAYPKTPVCGRWEEVLFAEEESPEDTVLAAARLSLKYFDSQSFKQVLEDFGQHLGAKGRSFLAEDLKQANPFRPDFTASLAAIREAFTLYSAGTAP